MICNRIVILVAVASVFAFVLEAQSQLKNTAPKQVLFEIALPDEGKWHNLQLSPVGNTFAIGRTNSFPYSSGEIQLWDAETKSIQASIKANGRCFRSTQFFTPGFWFTQSGNHFATAAGKIYLSSDLSKGIVKNTGLTEEDWKIILKNVPFSTEVISTSPIVPAVTRISTDLNAFLIVGKTANPLNPRSFDQLTYCVYHKQSSCVSLVPWSDTRRNIRRDVLSAVYEFATDDGKSIFGAQSISKQNAKNPKRWATERFLVKYLFATGEFLETGVELGGRRDFERSHGISPHGHLALSNRAEMIVIDIYNRAVMARGTPGLGFGYYGSTSSDINQSRFASIMTIASAGNPSIGTWNKLETRLLVWEPGNDPEKVNYIIKEDTVSPWDPSKGLAEWNLHRSVSVVGNKTGVLMVECKLVSRITRKLEEAWKCKNRVVILGAPVRPSE
jgi:hypothetical protein